MTDFQALFKSEVEFADAVIRKEFTRSSCATNDTLTQAMEYSLFSGGKRVRPIVLKWVSELGEPVDKILDPSMAAIEYIHTYSLIHDDLPAMDNDDLRRGKPTSHKKYGEAMAILAGDALLTESFRLLAKTGNIQLTEILSEHSGARGMVGGQAADILAEDDIIYINELKTAMLFRAAALMGAVAGGLDQDRFQSIADYGLNLGRAFQLRDDVLDEEYQSRKKAESKAKKFVEMAKEAISVFPDNAKLLDLAEFVIARSH